MTWQISTPHNEARLAATLAYLDAGVDSAALLIYDGTRPAIGGTPAGTLLATIVLAKPSGSVGAGVLTLAASPTALASASGTPTWARFVSGAGSVVMDCDVSAVGGSGDVQLTTMTLYIGGSIAVAGGTLG